MKRSVLLLMPLLLVCGCAEREFAAQQQQLREEKLERTLVIAVESEVERPERLRGFGREVEYWWTSDVERTRGNVPEYIGCLREDVDRFIERQPAYRDELFDVFWGKPERIERNMIGIFY